MFLVMTLTNDLMIGATMFAFDEKAIFTVEIYLPLGLVVSQKLILVLD